MTPLERLYARPRRTATLTFAYDPNLTDAITDARTAMFVAEGDDLVAAQARLAQLEAEAVTVRFDLVGIGAEKVKAILKAHPAEGPDADPLWDAWLLVDLCRKVTLSDAPDDPITDLIPEQMARILDRLSDVDRDALTIAAMRLDKATTLISGSTT